MEKENLELLASKGFSQRKIGDILGLGQTSIAYWLKKYEILTTRNRPFQKKTCNYCGKYLSRKWGKKFCNNKCKVQLDYKIFIEEWLSEKKDGVVAGGMRVSSYIRRWLREKHGHCCEICGWMEINPKTGTCPVQVNHIDGDALNNRPENLQLICPNCHSLTSNFGGLNKGKGRHIRAKYCLGYKKSCRVGSVATAPAS